VDDAFWRDRLSASDLYYPEGGGAGFVLEAADHARLREEIGVGVGEY
jgi:hypothetical protein